MNTFDEILNSILKSIEDNPSIDVDEVIAQKMSEMGISDESKKTLSETNSYLEAYDEMYAKLQAAKAEGDTRREWVQEELLSIADRHHLSEEQKEKLFSDITSACDNSLKTTISKGE